MPKIFVLRHQLAEQQARLSGDFKETISQASEEVRKHLNICIQDPSETWNRVNNYILQNESWDTEDAHEEIEEEPLELVTRKPEPGKSW